MVNTASSTETHVLLMHLVDLHFNHGLQEIVHEAFFFLNLLSPFIRIYFGQVYVRGGREEEKTHSKRI